MMPDGNSSESQRYMDPTSSGRLIKLDSSDSGPDPTPTTTRRRRRQRMPGLAMLPTALTLGNVVSGVAALIELTKAYAATVSGNDGEFYTRIGYASLLILAGMLFDALDGKVARMTATTGRFGAELDSLCDAVTFGIVPALMIRVAGEFFFASYDFDTKVLWGISALYACCAILRLARYNVETDDENEHGSFRGLPSPAAAASVAAMFLGLVWLHQNFESADDQPWPWVLRFFIPLTAGVIGLLMVSRFRYVHLFNRLVTRKQSLRTMVIFLMIVMTMIVLHEYWQLLAPGLMLLYVLSGPVYFAIRFVRGRGLLGRRLALAEKKRQRDERKTTS